jgi:hypothetical protein
LICNIADLTFIKALGYDPTELQAVQIERITPLPFVFDK